MKEELRQGQNTIFMLPIPVHTNTLYIVLNNALRLLGYTHHPPQVAPLASGQHECGVRLPGSTVIHVPSSCVEHSDLDKSFSFVISPSTIYAQQHIPAGIDVLSLDLVVDLEGQPISSIDNHTIFIQCSIYKDCFDKYCTISF